MNAEEERWIEDDDDSGKDTDDNDNDDDEEQPMAGFDLFSTDQRDPNDEFNLTLGGISLRLRGIQASYPHLLRSTGMTLWKGSEKLCEYLCAHPTMIRDKDVVELGAGLGLCGIVAHKHGARRVIMTDGDTDTLGNMRSNVASNIVSHTNGDDGGEHPDEKNDDSSSSSIFCKQLVWGKKVDEFCEIWTGGGSSSSSNGGFDVVMGGDIAYAQDSLEILFETALGLLSNKHGSVFLLSFVFRGGVTIDSVTACAKNHALEWTAPEDGDTEGVYVFSRSQ